MNAASGGYRRNSSVSVIALLDVLSLLEAFLSGSTTLNIAAANTIVEELRIAHEGSSYPRIADIMQSPTNGLIRDDSGASNMIILKTFNEICRRTGYKSSDTERNNEQQATTDKQQPSARHKVAAATTAPTTSFISPLD